MSKSSLPVEHPDGTSALNPHGSDPLPPLDPRTTAVVAVDVQRLFTDLAGAPIEPPLAEVLPRIGQFLQHSRRTGAAVVLVRTIIDPDAHSRSTLQWPPFMRDGLAPGATGTEFDPCLDVQPEDHQIVKQRYSAFFGTQLDRLLRDRGMETVVVLGLTTNVCVQSTARDAWQHDYRTVTVADCCAEVGPGSHGESLAWTSRNFGLVVPAHELVEAWQRYSRHAGR